MIKIQDVTEFIRSTASVDDLEIITREVSSQRATLHPEIERTVPNLPRSVHDPVWQISPYEGGALLQIRHPGFGWLAFTFPPLERAKMLFVFLNQVTPSIQLQIHNLKQAQKPKKIGK